MAVRPITEYKFDATHYQRLAADCYKCAMDCFVWSDLIDAVEFQELGAYWSKIARKKMGLDHG